MSRQTLLFALIAFMCGAALALVAASFFGGAALRFEPPASARTSAPELDPLLERLDRVEAALRALQLDAPSAPPAAAGSLSPPPEDAASARVPLGAPARDEELEQRLASLEAAITALRESVAEHMPPMKFPSADQFRRAPAEQNREALKQLRALDAPTALRSVQGLTQEEVLQLYGRPTVISPSGRWFYSSGSITFCFVQDYVVSVEH